MGGILDDDALGAALEKLSFWKKEKNALRRECGFATFRQAIAAINRIADAAEGANHHPDLTLGYTRLGIALSTHDKGGVTEKDVQLAAVIDDILKDFSF